MIQGHGGGVDALARQLGCHPSDVVDLSSNINPIGPMPEVVDYLRSTVAGTDRLPEPDAGSAIAAQAGVMGLPSSWLVAGNGTTELIYAAPRALGSRRALIVGPTYSDYADACRMAGVETIHHTTRSANGFLADPRRLIHKAAAVDTVFWCNPNNPTGTWAPSQDLAELCRSCPDTRFIVDESYLDFLEEGDAQSLIRYRLPNVVVLVSLSKMDALAGLRIGFAAAPPHLTRTFRQIAVPWSMNRLAQAAAIYLAEHPEAVAAHRRVSRLHLARVRTALMSALSDLIPVEWTDSRTSFILGRMPSQSDTDALVHGLAQRRFLIRHCKNFFGLSGRYFRISLKTEAVHERLRAAVADVWRRYASI